MEQQRMKSHAKAQRRKEIMKTIAAHSLRLGASA
jgi:hypothetical protein